MADEKKSKTTGDAEKGGLKPVQFALIAILLGIMGFQVYLIAKNLRTPQTAPGSMGGPPPGQPKNPNPMFSGGPYGNPGVPGGGVPGGAPGMAPPPGQPMPSGSARSTLPPVGQGVTAPSGMPPPISSTPVPMINGTPVTPVGPPPGAPGVPGGAVPGGSGGPQAPFPGGAPGMAPPPGGPPPPGAGPPPSGVPTPAMVKGAPPYTPGMKVQPPMKPVAPSAK